MSENFHLLFGEITMVLKVPLFIPLAPCVFLQLCALPRLMKTHSCIRLLRSILAEHAMVKHHSITLSEVDVTDSNPGLS